MILTGGGKVCNQCGVSFIPWVPTKDDGQTAHVAAAIGSICRSCFDIAQEGFVELKKEARELRDGGVDPRMVERIMKERV
ncbi:MAG: hypothetical protein WC683_01010 [bacterium]